MREVYLSAVPLGSSFYVSPRLKYLFTVVSADCFGICCCLAGGESVYFSKNIKVYIYEN